MGATGEPPDSWDQTMNFPYAAYEVEPTPSQPEESIIYRPIIPFRLTGSAGAAVFYGLLDTGADETLLPRAMAELVDVAVDLSPATTMLSASGEVEVVYGQVTLEVGRGRGRYRWQGTVGIVDQPWEEAVLGHAGFLRYFDVTFFGERREARLKRNRLALPQPVLP